MADGLITFATPFASRAAFVSVWIQSRLCSVPYQTANAQLRRSKLMYIVYRKRRHIQLKQCPILGHH